MRIRISTSASTSIHTDGETEQERGVEREGRENDSGRKKETIATTVKSEQEEYDQGTKSKKKWSNGECGSKSDGMRKRRSKNGPCENARANRNTNRKGTRTQSDTEWVYNAKIIQKKANTMTRGEKCNGNKQDDNAAAIDAAAAAVNAAALAVANDKKHSAQNENENERASWRTKESKTKMSNALKWNATY